jgi:muramoyltetrapeptide carboxypeptidase
MGFSDITSLLNAIFIKTGLVTFHGLVGVNTWNQFSTDVFNRVVCNGENCSFPLEENSIKNFITINKGKAQGKLVGGNLSVLSGIVGSQYFELPENSILFLEETNEEPYVVDRLLTHLKLAKVYDKLNGVIFGQCSKCIAENPGQSMLTIDVIREHFSSLKIPVSYGSPIGHVVSKWTLPIGIEVEMDADSGSLVLLQSAVS